MTTVAEAFVTLRPDVSKFRGETESKLGALGGLASKAVTGFAAVAAVAAAVAGVTIRAAVAEEAGIQRLSQAIDSNGGSWAKNGADVEAQIAKWERLTAFSDGELRDSLAGLVAITGDVDTAMARMPIAADFARGANIDLATASRLLGKVTDETTTVLGRYGIRVDKNADATDVLRLVQQKFAGQSAAFARTSAGSWAIFHNQLDNLKEDIGTALLPTFTRFVQAATRGVDFLREKWRTLGPVFTATIAQVQNLWNASPVKTFVVAVFNELSKLPGFVANVAGSIGEIFEVLTGSKPEAGGELRRLVGDDNAVGIMKTIGNVREAFKKVFDLMKPIVQAVIDKVVELKQKFDDLPPVLQKFAAGLVVGQVTGFNTAVAGLAISSVSATSGLLNIGKAIAGAGGLQAVLGGGASAVAGFAGALVGPAAIVAAIALAIWAVVEVVKTVILVIENWDKVLILLGRAFEGPRRGIEDLWRGIQNFFAPIGRLIALFQSDFPSALGILVGAVLRFKQDAGDAIARFIADALNAFLELPGKTAGVFTDLIGKIIEVIGTWWSTAGPAVGQFLSDVKDGFLPLVGALKTAAGNAIGGFIAGLLEGIPNALTAAADFVGKFIAGVKKGFGEKSPSTVFAGIGENLMRGLAQGITAGAGIPQAAMDGIGLSGPVLDAGIGGDRSIGGRAGAPPAVTVNVGPLTLNYTGPADAATVRQMGADTLDYITQNVGAQLARLGTGLS